MPVLIDQDGQQVELGAKRPLGEYSSPAATAFDGGPFFGGRPVSYAKTFTSQPWVYIAVTRLLTWSVRVPIKMYRRLDEDGARVRVRPNEHPLARALVTPWDRGSMAHLVMSLLGPLCIQGNGLMDVEEGAGNQIRFDPIDWRTVVPIRLEPTDPNSEIEGWKIYSPGATYTRSADNVMHLRWWSPLGNTGVSPLQILQKTLTSETAAMDWALNNLKQGVRPSGVIELTDEALKLESEKRQTYYEGAVDDIRRMYGGEANAGKLPVLPPGFKFTTAEHTTAVEAELMAQRTANRNEVAACYQLPPPSIGILDDATYSNIEVQRQMAYSDGLAPPLILAEQTFNACVVEGLLREDDVFVEFDFAGILRPDRLKEVQALRESINSGLLTHNEGRDVLNLPRFESEKADKLYISANNLKAIDEDSSAAEQSATAQRLVQPVQTDMVTKEEARELIGLGDESDPAAS